MDGSSVSSFKLFIRVMIKFSMVFIIMGILFFETAGTFSYMNGWLYLGTILVILGIGLAMLFKKDRQLLEKRIKTKETDPKQKIFVAISILLICLIYSIPGFDFRYKWTRVPLYIVIIGEIVLLIGYALYLKVMMINSYASRTIEIQKDQKLIDTGLYSIVRHPMYMSISLVYLGTCLVLGSYISLIPCVFMIILLGFRAKNEEEMLIHGLDGYVEYIKKVKYRIIPNIW